MARTASSRPGSSRPAPSRPAAARPAPAGAAESALAGHSVELLKALHILTREGQLNQDSRRKLKQIQHLYQFIEPLLRESTPADGAPLTLVDHGAGKSYLGFILYDLFFKQFEQPFKLWSIETRPELIEKSRELARSAGFAGMEFLNLSVAQATTSPLLPERIDVVTALHACNTATDDAIDFALAKRAQHVVLVPCCQAEVAAAFRQGKADALARSSLAELWRHPLHTREFGSQVTNVLRCLRLQAHGYQVTVTELVGWEHSMKNELIIATQKHQPGKAAARRLNEMLDTLGLQVLRERFAVPQT
jgi:hypothetical protein